MTEFMEVGSWNYSILDFGMGIADLYLESLRSVFHIQFNPLRSAKIPRPRTLIRFLIPYTRSFPATTFYPTALRHALSALRIISALPATLLPWW